MAKVGNVRLGLTWDRDERAPFILCVWLMLAVGIQNGFAHPTFPQYFIPMIPAATILATLGLYRLATRLEVLERPAKLIGALGLIFLVGALRGMFENRDDFTWRKVERAAQKVEEVTPKGATLLGAEQIYFLTHRTPPEGMEFGFSHKLDFGPERNALLHILPRKELERRISARAYSTDAVCDDSDEVDRVDGLDIYAQKADLGECTIFWSFKPAAPASPQATPSLDGSPKERRLNRPPRCRTPRVRRGQVIRYPSAHEPPNISPRSRSRGHRYPRSVPRPTLPSSCCTAIAA